MKKRALITGITGQDGSYLAEFLLSQGYEVHGMIRRVSSFNTSRIDHIFDQLKLHYGDMSDGTSIMNILAESRPEEVYNLAAQSHVKVSFELPEYTAISDGLGVLKLLEAVKALKLGSRVYQAGTSEMYGNFAGDLNEYTIMNPVSPYGTSKLFAHNICKNYRDSYGMHVSNGILFNHESPRRGETFVTRKITKAVAMIRAGRAQCVTLGNPFARRDWGHAKEYVKAMWMMLQQEEPDDYVIATGEDHSVADFANIAFGCVGINLEWNNIGAVDKNGTYRVKLDDRYRRPNELHSLTGDPSKAERELGWKAKTTFEELVREMVKSDVKEVNSCQQLSTAEQGC